MAKDLFDKYCNIYGLYADVCCHKNRAKKCLWHLPKTRKKDIKQMKTQKLRHAQLPHKPQNVSRLVTIMHTHRYIIYVQSATWH